MVTYNNNYKRTVLTENRDKQIQGNNLVISIAFLMSLYFPHFGIHMLVPSYLSVNKILKLYFFKVVCNLGAS